MVLFILLEGLDEGSNCQLSVQFHACFCQLSVNPILTLLLSVLLLVLGFNDSIVEDVLVVLMLVMLHQFLY